VSHQAIVELIGAITTRSGRKVRAALDNGAYPLGVRVSDGELAAVPLRWHDWHGEWNDTVLAAAA
jgi:Rhodopirellula transposase DDE domain